MNYWLMKTEPSTYSWEDLKNDGETYWDGVRNYGARNHMCAMKTGDLVIIYHSVNEKTLCGIAKVVKEAYRDHTAEKGDWSMVDIAPVEDMPPVTLADVKANPKLKEMVLVTNSRLSVQPLKKEEWDAVMRMASKVDRD
ncbi:MAG: EVE domain-containing protein [bacterium]|nr:EVE domain-containing protein [bacterium]